MHRVTETKNKTKGVIRFLFPYGSDDWDFAYITIYYIEQFYIGKFVRESDIENLNAMKLNGSILLCGNTQKAHIERLDIAINPIQSMQFIKSADELSNLMIQNGGLEFTELFLKWLRNKHTRFHSAKELEGFYLRFSTGYIRRFNEHYSGSSLEAILDKTWERSRC